MIPGGAAPQPVTCCPEMHQRRFWNGNPPRRMGMGVASMAGRSRAGRKLSTTTTGCHLPPSVATFSGCKPSTSGQGRAWQPPHAGGI
jgi:hypothetical protein